MTVRPIAVAYIPESDPDALKWMENFHRILEFQPSAFGVDTRDVGVLGDLIRNFQEKSELNVPTERVIARNAVIRAVGRLADTIAANALTTDDDLSKLQLPARGTDEQR